MAMSRGRNLAGLANTVRRYVYCVVLFTFFGCATHVQTQLFCVKDPNTGAANYYCLTIRGSSTSKYNFQAGYFSSAAVDILRGNMPSVPELDLPVERITNYDRMLDFIDQDVQQEAKAIAPIT